MPKVRMKTRACGAINARPGQEIEVSKAQHDQLVQGGYAESLEPKSDKAPADKPKGK